MHRPRILLVALVCGLLSPLAARGGVVTQDPCPGRATAPEVWKSYGTDVLENLLFADGSLWISNSTSGRLIRLGPDGVEQAGLDGVAPGGLAVGPDGLIYVGSGNSIQDSLLRRGLSKVLRFDPADPGRTLQTYAAGFDMANGMTFAPDGDLFVSNDVGYGPVRIPRAQPSAWTSLGIWGTNGLVVDPAGENLYAAITFDQRSPIERIPLGDTAAHDTAVVLTAGVVSLEPAMHTDPDVSKPLVGLKGLDDMTRTADGTLYVVANGLGELLRVDPVTGDACLVTGGLQNPASVRIAPSGSPFDVSGEALTLYVVGFDGRIKVVGYTP
jgi:hypothetical protein